MTTRSASAHRQQLLAGRWFHDLPAPLQDALIAAGEVQAFAAGAVLFSRGDPYRGMYGVLEGAIRASGSDADGNEALLTLAEAPSWLGEIPLFDGLPRTHDAVAEVDSLVLHLPLPALTAILDREPRYWRNFALLLTAKLRLAFVAMEDRALLPIAPQLIRRLVLIAEGYGEWYDRSARVVQVSQEKLATMLGSSRQTVNQVLKTLEAQGLVRLSYGQVEVVDLDGLRRAAHESI